MGGKEIFPSELVILMAIALASDSGKTLLTRPMDITGEYVSYLYNSLVSRGYIEGNSSRGYQFTSKGRETLFEFLRTNRARLGDAVKTLQQLRIEVNHETGKFKKEAIEVK